MATIQVVANVYYYPPEESNGNTVILPNNVDALNMDSTYGILVAMSFHLSIEQATEWLAVGGPTGFGLTIAELTHTFTILMTPQAYINWYNNNINLINQSSKQPLLESFYTQLNSSNQNKITADYITAHSWYWKEYNAYYSVNGGAPTGSTAEQILLNSFESQHSQELYVLLNPSYTPQSTVTLSPIVLVAVFGVGLLVFALFASRAFSGVKLPSVRGGGRHEISEKRLSKEEKEHLSADAELKRAEARHARAEASKMEMG